MPTRTSHRAEACFNWRDRAPIGSLERQLFTDAAEEYLFAQRLPSGNPEKIRCAMRARRLFVKALKISDQRHST